MSSAFSEFLKQTTPGPRRPCDECGTASLRTYTPPDTQVPQVICHNKRCSSSPIYEGPR
jgi:hypothetical protein